MGDAACVDDEVKQGKNKDQPSLAADRGGVLDTFARRIEVMRFLGKVFWLVRALCERAISTPFPQPVRHVMLQSRQTCHKPCCERRILAWSAVIGC
jgi:hypothetical protein